MGNTDSVPVISQVKSAVQAVSGDREGALQTQKNFVRGCPGVSQVVATGQYIAGDREGAKETFTYGFKNISNMVDGVPVVGHAKGLIHYACGDEDGGNNAMLSATRSTCVLAGGVAGGLVGGPAGAVIGGIAGGATNDTASTAVDSAVKGTYSPHGHLAMLDRAVKGKMDVGTAFDWAMMPIFDGIAGRAYSKTFESIRLSLQKRSLRAAIEEAVRTKQITLAEGETITSLVEELQAAGRELASALEKAKETGTSGSPSVASTVIDVKGNRYVGYSFKLRQAVQADHFHGEVPSALQLLENKSKVRGMAHGQPACGEVGALHQHHRANGLNAAPSRTITVGSVDGKNIQAVARCNNCAKIGKYVNMGEVPTDVLHGKTIPLEAASFEAAIDLLPTLDCDCDEENDKKEN